MYADKPFLLGGLNTCSACALNTPNKVPGHGHVLSRLMLVGEAPGAEEDRLQKPFVGRAGKMLDELLSKAGVDRGMIYVTNTCKCRPPGNRTPKGDEIMKCGVWLEHEIDLVRPKVIVALGNTALSFFGYDGVGRLRGKELSSHGAVLVPTYHPSFLLRPNGRDFADVVVADLTKAYSLSCQVN